MNGNTKKEIVSLNGENGKKLEFELIAELEYDGYNYQILYPIKKYKDLDSDQAIVFRLENTENGTEYFIEEDDDIINEIEKIYNEEN
ncbi:MAG: DUF1292 domain-containing protein [Acholeplasmatales bacterium]|nr:DUF1292 domain-containing protein [Acholeplasmatales bacterium]